LYNGDQRLLKLRGAKRKEVAEIRLGLKAARSYQVLKSVIDWQDYRTNIVTGALREQRWIPTETVEALLSSPPSFKIPRKIAAQNISTCLSPGMRKALVELGDDVEAQVADVNKHVIELELQSRRQFFDTIEKSPLTREQAEAVIRFDNRVQLLAGAGSGKTSVMVARAAYAVARGFVPPERILLLAFNKAAAEELPERVNDRFSRIGLEPEGVRASTFHSFGLSVIGQATGKKPRLARWLDQGAELDTIMDIVDELRDSSEEFRYKWDLFRLLFARALLDLDEDQQDSYDSESRRTGYEQLSGIQVKSHGERLIGDFMFLSGVEFEYEKAYVVDTVTPRHGQYHPAFYYPDVDVWHEHWGLDSEGQPRKDAPDYLEQIEWKRGIHKEHETTLVESTWASVMFEDGLVKLQRNLEELGLAFDFNPDREIGSDNITPLKHEDLARLVRTFMTHVKSNSMTKELIGERLAGLPDSDRARGYRSSLFLDIYWPVHEMWQNRLLADGAVDFEDMLVLAANLVESGQVKIPYDLILVDEFQDASQARARLVRGALKEPGKYLLAVGDDWQAINRFAGADISVMRDFEIWFGRGQQCSLTLTFRCPQTICDVASQFIKQNPQQLQKTMRSNRSDPGKRVLVLEGESKTQLEECIERIRNEVGNGEASVMILGRYNFLKQDLPRTIPPNLNVEFRTIHSSKGLEADYVILIGITAGTYGLPSNIADDPVLSLAMPNPETFEHAEERRLFYVALTRARREAILITPRWGGSPFVAEILADPDVEPPIRQGKPVQVCPSCNKGTLAERNGPNGVFYGCSAFPVCRFSTNKLLDPSLNELQPATGVPCPRCAAGRLVQKSGKFGVFLGCTSYPKCRFTRNQ